jgi:CubicO group peptidase (beta-lactamase class C family)
MTSGMNYNLNMPEIKEVVEKTGGLAPTLDVCRALAHVPLDFEPGEDYKYSLSFDVLGGVIEVVTGMKLRDYVKENIFDPLGMKDTSFHIDDSNAERMATMYAYDSTLRAPKIIPFTNDAFVFGKEYDSGGAGIVSSVDDYILFADALAMGGVGKNGERIISKYGIDLIRANIQVLVQLLPLRLLYLLPYP